MYAKFPGREIVHIRSINSKIFPTSDIFFLEFEGIDIKCSIISSKLKEILQGEGGRYFEIRGLGLTWTEFSAILGGAAE